MNDDTMSDSAGANGRGKKKAETRGGWLYGSLPIDSEHAAQRNRLRRCEGNVFRIVHSCGLEHAQWDIWGRCLSEFLWPGGEDKSVTESVSYSHVHYWLGSRIVPEMRLDLRVLPTYLGCLAEAETAELEREKYFGRSNRAIGVFNKVEELWESRWDSVPMLDEKGRLKPGSKMVFDGMRFCLMILVLRYGVGSGRGGRVTWKDATEAASLFLACTMLERNKGVTRWMEALTWHDVRNYGAGLARRGIEGGGKLKELPDMEGIDGLWARLCVTMETEKRDEEWERVKKLAAEYEAHGKGAALNRWAKAENLGNWFAMAGR